METLSLHLNFRWLTDVVSLNHNMRSVLVAHWFVTLLMAYHLGVLFDVKWMWVHGNLEARRIILLDMFLMRHHSGHLRLQFFLLNLKDFLVSMNRSFGLIYNLVLRRNGCNLHAATDDLVGFLVCDLFGLPSLGRHVLAIGGVVACLFLGSSEKTGLLGVANFLFFVGNRESVDWQINKIIDGLWLGSTAHILTT